MKSKNQFGKWLRVSDITLAISALVWLPGQALAQDQVKGAQKLMKVQTAVVEKTFKAVKPEEVKNVPVHLCSSCSTKVVTTGVGKQAKDTLVHTCKACGSEDVACCVMKKGEKATKGMEKGDRK